MNKVGGKAAKRARARALREIVNFGPLKGHMQQYGFLRRGPDWDEHRQGWFVYAEPAPGIDVPVTLTSGHTP